MNYHQIFASKTAELLTYHQKETKQIYPKEGWVEQDPVEILNTVLECIEKAADNLRDLGLSVSDIKAIGITNQRESTVVWDKITGKPLHNAIIWLDLRTASTVEKLVKKTPQQDKDYLRPYCGLPLSTYFSAVKLRWLLDNCPKVQQAVDEGRCLFGTVDSWLLWNLTGGVDGGKHLTDVTNASRTMLMNIHELQWDPHLCKFFNVKMEMLPEIRSSAEIYGHMCKGVLKGLPISGILGDQQAALVGQLCFKQGQSKNTYGTGCFLLYNTGLQPVESKTGLLTTIGYKLGKDKPVIYALEGAIAISGACVQWLRDNLGIIKTSAEIENLASTVDNTADCYFVPAFSGLFCPYWQSDARGIICGLSQFTNKAHIARAALEAVCFQTRELLEAMNKDSGIPMTSMQVDGGMTQNDLLMQLQADILGINVVRPSMPETTALGAAMAAGSAEGVGVWDISAQSEGTITTDVFTPSVSAEDRDKRFARWKAAINRSKHWVEAESEGPADSANQSSDVANGLQELLDYEGNVEEDFCMTFEMSYTELGETKTHRLKTDGDKLPVTNKNRKDYVARYVDFVLNKSMYQQFQAFYHGFHSVCASNALIMLRPEEVETLVCGNPNLDMEELKKVTVYDGYNPQDQAVRYLGGTDN